MKCPNCKCEIANLTDCPYCGVHLVRRNAPQATQRAAGSARTTPVGQVPKQERIRYSKRDSGNVEMWLQIGVCLLSGIFVLEVVQLLLQLL